MIDGHRARRLALTVAVGCLFLVPWASTPSEARRPASPFVETLSASDKKEFEAWLTAQTFYDAELDAYWDKVEAKRSARRKKKAAEQVLTASDYVTTQPPDYKGPTLAKRLAEAWNTYQKADDPAAPAPPPEELPTVDDYLKAARSQYGFVPERIAEREFKQRYAREALRLGLDKDQVVRVYALETGGLGTADMQAGIHPIRRTGKPISSALGYAQLLNANSVGELVTHGADFLERLRRMARAEGVGGERRARLEEKIAALEKMVARVRRVKNEWSAHVAFARTLAGQGVHAINIDGDIGPWLQVIKLKGIKDFAERKGRTNLDPTALELMNLAGPATGLEMMTSVGLGVPTANFFARRGYYRNSIVRGRSSQELMTALKERMDQNMKNSGAIEFSAVFDELLSGANRITNQ
ncbi:MAG: hypothetical protein NW217_09550 [Hyphomicrobiaceae bacterium]|nr:hypothetical protein [Hyphomicrobiaceae bacterium]